MIKYPFTFKDVETKYVIMACLLSWLPTVLFVSLALCFRMTSHDLMLINTIVIFIVMTVLVLTNIMIYRIVKKHDEFLQKNASQSKHNFKKSKKSKNKKDTTKKPNKHLKASYACFSIVASFVLLWLPYLICNLMTLMNLPLGILFWKIENHFILFNPMADIVLFVWLNGSVKREIVSIRKKIVRTLSHSSGNESNTSMNKTVRDALVKV